MKEIDTQVTTYDHSVVPSGDPSNIRYVSIMFPDRAGNWIDYAAHERVVRALQDRIIYLENVCYEQNRMLTGD